MHFVFPSVTVLLCTFALASTDIETIPLPLGFGPEGISRGKGNRLFVGNLRNGSIYRLNLRTNKSRIIVKPFKRRLALGLAIRHQKLFVAGGGSAPIGSGRNASFYVYNTTTGKQIAACNITRARFLNGVTIRSNKAYFSDSASSKIFVVPIKTVRSCKFSTIPLPDVFKSPGDGRPRGNGVVFFKGRLLVVNTAERTVYTVDPKGHERSRPLMPPGSVEGPDGLAIKNRKLYVVDNVGNKIHVWLLRKRATGRIKARKLRSIRSDTFRTPSSAAIIKNKLYVVNFRFDELPFTADVSEEQFTLSVVPL